MDLSKVVDGVFTYEEKLFISVKTSYINANNVILKYDKQLLKAISDDW